MNAETRRLLGIKGNFTVAGGEEKKTARKKEKPCSTARCSLASKFPVAFVDKAPHECSAGLRRTSFVWWGGGRQAGLVHCGEYSCVTGELLRADSGSQLSDRGNRAGALEGKL